MTVPVSLPSPTLKAAESYARRDWPEPLGEAAHHGVLGDIVNTIAPESETDPAALMSQLLCCVGNIMGRNRYIQVEKDHHFPNLYICLVGSSSLARKGTAFGQVRSVVLAADDGSLDFGNWSACIQGGLTSGEGLVYHVRDASTLREDPGVSDKRLCAVEKEFARVLRVKGRESNILSSQMREFWDDGDAGSLAKHNPTKATGAHVSIIGHVTIKELAAELSSIDMANGFGNRFQWFLVKRTKELPFGGNLDQRKIDALLPGLRDGIRFGQTPGHMTWGDDARAMWPAMYAKLSTERPGQWGELVSRAAPQVLRVALIYACMDQSPVLREVHLRAAYEIVRYSEESVRYIFGGSSGNPALEKMQTALREAEARGLTRTELHRKFKNHLAADQLDALLAQLREMGVAKPTSEKTGGRFVERWHFVGAAN